MPQTKEQFSAKEEYSKLAKAHKLPEFDSLDKEFEISSIDQTNFLLREIRRKMAEKFECYSKVLEPTLQPDAHIIDMHECKILDDNKKARAYEIFKIFMYLDRYSTEASISETDEKTASYINEAWKQWSSIKNEFSSIVKMLKESWLQDTDIEEELGYMG